MYKHKVIIILLIFVSVNSVWAQDSNKSIFTEAISLLYKETQADKAKYQEQYKTSEANIEKYRKEKPTVSVFGGSKEENEKLKEVVEEAVEEVVFEDMEIETSEIVEDVPPPPPPPPLTSKNTTNRSGDSKKVESIEFTTTPMFPNEPKGLEIFSASVLKSKPREKIEWVSGPTTTYTTTVHIDDIKDPKERQRLLDMGQHSQNVSQLNKIGFIEAIYNSTKSDKEYTKLMAELKENGFDFTNHFRKMAVLENKDKVPFIKAKIEEMVEKVVGR